MKNIVRPVYRKILRFFSDLRIIFIGIIGYYNDDYGSNIVNRKIDYNFDGNEIDVSIIFSTSEGICIFDNKNNISKQILIGHSYGITKSNNYWFVQRTVNRDKGVSKDERVSNIVKFKIINFSVEDLSTIIFGWRREIHQIDFIGKNLYLPYTGYNQILIYDLNKNIFKKLAGFHREKIELDIFEPSHLNSIYSDDQYIYVIAHNLTAKTNRFSDLIIYDRKTKKINICNLHAHSAHNVIKINESLYYCDSNNKDLYCNQETIFSADKLLRGLSFTDDYIFVGGSDIDFVEDKRKSSDCTIYILKKNGHQIGQIDFPGLGNIYEIRQLNGVDYSLSNWRNFAKK